MILNQIKSIAISYFRLLRIPNLIIVGVTQYIIYHLLISTSFTVHVISGSFNRLDLFLFILTTLCITAGGYIINDIYDIKTDKINKPLSRVINQRISVKSGWFLYVSSTISGAFIAFYLAIQREEISYWFLYPTSVFLLFAYSKWLKAMPLIGNILVSLFCGAVPGIFYLSEYTGIKKLSQINIIASNNLKTILFSYVVFAFLTNLIREIVKDLQDEKGDRISKLNTTVVFWGQKTSKRIAFIVAIISSFIINYTFFLPLFVKIPYLYFLHIIFIQLPLLICMINLYQAKVDDEFKRIGVWIKIIMVNGLFLVTYIISLQNG